VDFLCAHDAVTANGRIGARSPAHVQRRADEQELGRTEGGQALGQDSSASPLIRLILPRPAKSGGPERGRPPPPGICSSAMRVGPTAPPALREASRAASASTPGDSTVPPRYAGGSGPELGPAGPDQDTSPDGVRWRRAGPPPPPRPGSHRADAARPWHVDQDAAPEQGSYPVRCRACGSGRLRVVGDRYPTVQPPVHREWLSASMWVPTWPPSTITRASRSSRRPARRPVALPEPNSNAGWVGEPASPPPAGRGRSPRSRRSAGVTEQVAQVHGPHFPSGGASAGPRGRSDHCPPSRRVSTVSAEITRSTPGSREAGPQRAPTQVCRVGGSPPRQRRRSSTDRSRRPRMWVGNSRRTRPARSRPRPR